MSSSGEPLGLRTPEQQTAREKDRGDFYASIGEKRQPSADIRVAATAALLTIMRHTATYERRMVTWKVLGDSMRFL